MTDEELAHAFVVGTLDGNSRDRVRLRAVEDRVFAATIAGCERRLAPLALALEPVTPPDVFAAIEARIGPGTDLPGTVTKRAGEGEWTEIRPGIAIKMMHENLDLKRHTFLARIEPGAEYVDHDHDQDEEIYMIDGDLIIGNVVLQAGDFHVAKAGKRHPVHRTRTGCLCLISQAIGPL